MTSAFGCHLLVDLHETSYRGPSPCRQSTNGVFLPFQNHSVSLPFYKHSVSVPLYAPYYGLNPSVVCNGECKLFDLYYIYLAG